MIPHEQPIARVAGVSDDSTSFPHTPSGVDVREGGKLTSNDVSICSQHPLQGFPVNGSAVAGPGSDTASQDALHGAGV